MPNISRRQFIQTAAAASLGTLLTALIPGGEAIAQENTLAVQSPAPNAWPLGTVPRNQTFIYLYGGELNGNFNPFSKNYNHQNGNAVLYEPCAFYNPLSGATTLWLAESYKYNVNATELTIVFRKGIKWSDGTAFTAEDAVWTITTLKNVGGLARSGYIASRVVSVAALDSLTIKITFNQTDWRFFSNVFTYRNDLGDVMFVPKSVFGSLPANELATTQYYDLAQQWPISTGPYGVGDLATNTFTNFDLRPTWWAFQTGLVNGMPQVVRFRSEVSDGTDAAMKLVNNQIDCSMDFSPTIIQAMITQNPEITTWTKNQSPYGSVDWWPISVYFNNLKPPFNDKRVRWAIAYAIDQHAVTNTAWGDASTVVGHPFPAYPHLMTYINGISDLLTTYNVLEFNLSKTNTLMTSAGFHKDTDGYWVDSLGVRPDANLYAPVPLFADIGPIIAQQLRNAGFDCTSVSPNTVWSDMFNGTASLFLFGHGGSTYDPLDTFNLYRPGNMARWSNPTFTNNANQMSLIHPDDPGMAALFHAGMAVWLDELPDCPITQWMHRIPVNTHYWINYPDQNNTYTPLALWGLTALQVVINLKMNLPNKTFLPTLQR